MPKLKKNAAADMVHGLGDPLPAGDLLVGIDAGCVGAARALMGNRSGICGDQAGRCPLLVLSH